MAAGDASGVVGCDHGGVPPGHHLRHLPDGGLEFLLEDPVLVRLIVGDQVTLRFGRTEVVITAPFDLEVDGVDHHLDPHRPVTLGPLLTTLPGAARWLWASTSGALTLVLMQGQRLVVPGPTVRSTWSVGDAEAPVAEAARSVFGPKE